MSALTQALSDELPQPDQINRAGTYQGGRREDQNEYGAVYHITVWIANEERQWVREPRLNRCRKLIPRDDENRCLCGREFKEAADGYATTFKMVAGPGDWK